MRDCGLLLGVLVLALALFQVADAQAHDGRDLSQDQTSQEKLLKLVRQDCGACHGLRLTGGLGPPLTPQALARLPEDYIAAVILHGKPGTAMPPWMGLLDPSEAQWIAKLLLNGLPPFDQAEEP